MSIKHFSTPGCYRIEVEGILPAEWFDRLGAMRILTSTEEITSQKTRDAVTTLQGKVSDQADLSGILNSLYELHLPLLSVQLIGDKTPSVDGAPDASLEGGIN